jgi:hypothetical protein
MNENKKGGRIRLIEIDQLLKNKFDIHYKNLNGVHNLTNSVALDISLKCSIMPSVFANGNTDVGINVSYSLNFIEVNQLIDFICFLIVEISSILYISLKYHRGI